MIDVLKTWPYIVKLEHLDFEWPALQELYAFGQVPHLHPSNRKPEWRDYFDSTTLRLAAEYYKRDLTRLGYGV
jgi:hypothetical protein